MMRTFARGLALALAFATVGATGDAGATGDVSATGQILAYQDGFVFFTNGDGFRVSPNLKILDDKTKAPSTDIPRARIYARAVFDSTGTVTELDLSRAPLPIQPFDVVAKFAVAASPSYPNPDLAPKPGDMSPLENAGSAQGSGRPVTVVITVEVPPLPPPTASIYLATDTSGWNPMAIQMDRIDALHYRITRRLAAGTIFRYLYTRGSLQSEERAQNGLDRDPRILDVPDADVRGVNDTVYNWADFVGGGQSQMSNPVAQPTPYNPAPFPNIPTGFPTPHPR